MSSEAKIAANGKNALKSTGPRTDRGKAKSRLNAVTHGISATTPVLPCEDADAYREIVKSNLEHFAPVGPTESLLVRNIITEQWRLERIDRGENALHARLIEGQIVRFFGSLNDREIAYVRSKYADELREEIKQDRRQREAAASRLPPKMARFGASKPAIPPKSVEETRDDVEARLGRIREPDSALLEILVPTAENAPQPYLVQERRTAMRAILAYVGKLQDLQEFRLTVTLLPQPQPTTTTQKRTHAQKPQRLLTEEAANQNPLKADNDASEK